MRSASPQNWLYRLQCCSTYLSTLLLELTMHKYQIYGWEYRQNYPPCPWGYPREYLASVVVRILDLLQKLQPFCKRPSIFECSASIGPHRLGSPQVWSIEDAQCCRVSPLETTSSGLSVCSFEYHCLDLRTGLSQIHRICLNSRSDFCRTWPRCIPSLATIVASGRRGPRLGGEVLRYPLL